MKKSRYQSLIIALFGFFFCIANASSVFSITKERLFETFTTRMNRPSFKILFQGSVPTYLKNLSRNDLEWLKQKLEDHLENAPIKKTKPELLRKFISVIKKMLVVLSHFFEKTSHTKDLYCPWEILLHRVFALPSEHESFWMLFEKELMKDEVTTDLLINIVNLFLSGYYNWESNETYQEPSSFSAQTLLFTSSSIVHSKKGKRKRSDEEKKLPMKKGLVIKKGKVIANIVSNKIS